MLREMNPPVQEGEVKSSKDVQLICESARAFMVTYNARVHVHSNPLFCEEIPAQFLRSGPTIAPYQDDSGKSVAMSRTSLQRLRILTFPLTLV